MMRIFQNRDFSESDRNELLALVGALQFSDREACTRYGDRWLVEVGPWPGDDDEHFTALVRIARHTPDGDLPCEGLQLVVRDSSGGDPIIAGLTDRRGLLRFRDIPNGQYGGVFLWKTLHLPEAALSLRAAAAPDRMEPKVFRVLHNDFGIELTLTRSHVHTRCLLSLFTEDEPEYAYVRVSVGVEEVQLQLRPCENAGGWTADHLLEQTFHEATGSGIVVKLIGAILPKEN